MTSANDHFRQAQKGDTASLYCWVESAFPDMGRFAYQLGVRYPTLPEFQKTSLLELQKHLGQLTPEQAKIQLYQLLIQRVSIQPIRGESTDLPMILSFQEDQELHDELQNLLPPQRVPIVLFYFHHFSLRDIAAILEISEQQVQQAIDEGLRTIRLTMNLNETQLVQRLTMLQKSYQRFVPLSPIELDIQRSDEETLNLESVKTSSTPQPLGKKSTMFLGTAGLFLALVIGISFTVNDQQAKTSGATELEQSEIVTDKMMTDWQSQYDTIKKTAPERLGMTPQQFEQLAYVKQADVEMERVFSDNMQKSLKDDPIHMQVVVDRLFRKIETPRGMVDSLAGPNPMLSTETEDFLLDYAAKTDELRLFVDNLLLKYQQELESTIVMDQLSPEKLLAQASSYPEELRLVVEALPEYNLTPIAHPKNSYFRTVRNVDNLTQQQPVMGDLHAGQYLHLLSSEPYFDNSGFLLPLESIPYHLFAMEAALLEEGPSSALLSHIEIAYQQIFWQLVKGSDNSPVFDEQGKVKMDYRIAWNSIASSNPMAFIMLPILKEMEASDWTTSTIYDELEFHHVMDALAMEKSGELANKLPNGNLKLEDEFVDLKDFDYSRIQSLYESFEASYDLQLLSGVSPLDVLFMYHYANKQEDATTQWHLLADSPSKPTLETFIKEWRKIPELTKTARWVELSNSSYTQRVKDKVYIYPGIDMYEFDEQLDLLLVTEKDQIWQIDYRQYESYDLQGEDQQFNQAVESLYASFATDFQAQLLTEAKPSEVAAMFFKAVENEDVPMMKKLMIETHLTDEEFVDLLALKNFRPFSELAQLTFRSHFTPNHPLGRGGTVEIQYYTTAQGNLFPEMFNMDKTKDGWRMSNINEY
ncbi:sigma factor-like helix-turn-helix DNA-binding protein [Planococcus sp. S3-L1]|uniref:RNA polymerase sigma factor n=1 Tax=Planococcus sp. S3-L1 TaxID=3046200 RepID=UPI0024B9B080|nr:sigma factor-like helix-turn-helix DNA-binding protein [Planococcus sp. S3-L1]MDJ0332046.1 sigma factor-like helix-turn-helix DNA-binding protein [Planococcus sp. S3-L1]